MEYAGHGSDKDGTADLSVTEQCRALSPDLPTSLMFPYSPHVPLLSTDASLYI